MIHLGWLIYFQYRETDQDFLIPVLWDRLLMTESKWFKQSRKKRPAHAHVTYAHADIYEFKKEKKTNFYMVQIIFTRIMVTTWFFNKRNQKYWVGTYQTKQKSRISCGNCNKSYRKKKRFNVIDGIVIKLNTRSIQAKTQHFVVYLKKKSSYFQRMLLVSFWITVALLLVFFIEHFRI